MQTNPRDQWRCRACQYPPCIACRRKRCEKEEDPYEGDAAQYRCETCKEATCKSCKETKPWASFSESIRTNPRDQWRCRDCQYPPCIACLRKRCEKTEAPYEGDPLQYTCRKCPKLACDECGQRKPESCFDRKEHRIFSSRCLECEYPWCAAKGCSKRHPRKDLPILKRQKRKDGRWFCPKKQCQKEGQEKT